MPQGTVTRFALAGSLFGSCSVTSETSLSNKLTGQPLLGREPLGTTETASRAGSAGTSTATGETPSTSGPAKPTLAFVPRFAASGYGVMALGKSPTRRR